MVKPAPTKTNAKPPVSLAPVKALSGATPAEQAEPKRVENKPAAVATATVPAQSNALAVEPAKPAPAKSDVAVSPAPAKAEPAKAVAAAPAPAAAKPVETRPAAARSAPVATSAKPPAKLTKTTLTRVPAAKARVIKGAAVTAPAAKPAIKLVAAQPATVKPAAVKLAPPAPGVAIPNKTVETTQKIAAVSVEAVKTAAKAAPTPIAALATMLPKPPEFAALSSATMMTQALGFARALSALQARILDHACSELKATLGDVETLARSDSAADAVALQAKAMRRGYEAYAAHLKDLAQVASASLRKG